MFKKPFNKQVGETRQCKHCSKDFHTFKPVYSCRDCYNKRTKEAQSERAGDGIVKSGKFIGMGLKKPYPFSTKKGLPLTRFRRIARELNAAWKVGTREAITAHYDKQFKEIQENGVLEWILDRRSDDVAKAKVIKSKNMTENDYPDLRGIQID
jgi:hypothetical protein